MRYIGKEDGVLAAFFFAFFLLLTPLGAFNDWIPPQLHTAYYSVTAIDMGDDAGYYAYLRSGFFDGDFDFLNEQNYAHDSELNPTGYVFNNWQVGQSLLFFPFFLLGHLAALSLNALGYPVAVDGYSFPYFMSTALASQTYLFLGLLVLCKTLRENFESRVAVASTLIIWLAGPLLYYSFIRQRMSHSIEFCLAAVYFRCWLQNRLSGDWARHAILGAVAGLLCSIRVINGAMFALYFVDQAALMWAERGRGDLPARLRAHAILWSGFLAFWFLLFLPQLFSWNGIDGAPFPVYHLGLAKREATSFAFDVLAQFAYNFFFGDRWGLIYSSPVIFAGMAGLLLKHDSHAYARPALLCVGAAFVAIVVQLYPHLVSYEYRYLSPALPVFAFGLASLLSRCARITALWWSVLVLGVAGALVQYLNMVQFNVLLPYDDPEYIRKALANIPDILSRYPGTAWYSTNWTKLMALKRGEWNFTDYAFLLIFPGAQLALVVAVMLVKAWREKRTEEKGAVLNAKMLLAGAAALSLLACATVVRMTPVKTPVEIAQRREYVELIRSGTDLQSLGRNDEALVLFGKAGSLQPQLCAPHYRLAALLGRRGELVASNAHFLKALENCPYHAPSLLSLGNNLMALGRLDDAEMYIRSALRVMPEFPGARASLAMLANLRKPAGS